MSGRLSLNGGKSCHQDKLYAEILTGRIQSAGLVANIRQSIFSQAGNIRLSLSVID